MSSKHFKKLLKVKHVSILLNNLKYLEMVRRKLLKEGPRDIKMLSLGYPDLLVRRQDLSQIFGEDFVKSLTVLEGSEEIVKWHGMQKFLPELYDTKNLFEGLDVSFDCVDIYPSRGFERQLDLNEPLPEDMLNKYDIVYDGGTLEHCFNIAQGMKNIAEAVVPGGYLVHGNPLSMLNHGFYNFNPTFYSDFYEQNNFKILGISALVGTGLFREEIALPKYRRFKDIPDGSSVLVVAKAPSKKSPIKWPMQTKYKENKELKIKE